ncbi:MULTISPECIES: arginyltransferase [Vibrio]|uniref:Aspartate/glutamate leucyltransferase n=2 Tax=Vibrio TaxID=662 RepID=A0A7X4LNZ4_9VIBR|nr:MULTISPECIES: arginyltransferase [Vibrio]MBF9000779.1 arginyltransferase [Vibrio nitrifigilis]MZI95473.1 arginyltransferase [Vibrio eleionomae]
MSSDIHQIRIGLTNNHPCSYLDDKLERVAVAIDPQMQSADNFEVLLANGFRRSGDTIYKPHCDHCKACQALRVNVVDNMASKSQKRLLAKARDDFHWVLKDTLDDNWFDLYARYIRTRHRNGTMFPPQKDEFLRFSLCEWLNTQFLHVYQHDQLVAVAVTDVMSQCASAFYTFFDPDISLSLGTLCILYQLQMCKNEAKQWLYLGYQIDQCPAMNYKVRFHSHQRLVNQRWRG